MKNNTVTDEFDRSEESDISDLELLAQTQLTNNLMTRGVQNSQITTTNLDSRSRIFAHLGASSIEPDLLSRSNQTSNSVVPSKSPVNMFRRLEDTESLNLTPEKIDVGADSI